MNSNTEGEQLDIFSSLTESSIDTSIKNQKSNRFTEVQLIELTCLEPIFFASREVSDTYYTEGLIGNYALAYALGWVTSPYRLQGEATTRPSYKEDLGAIVDEYYVLPASPKHSVKYRFERFNALSDSYWYAMTNNRVATAREDLPEKRDGGTPKTYRASNFPQTGRLRMIERGNKFQTLVFGQIELPNYIRIGKFLSKTKVTVIQKFTLENLPMGEYPSQLYLNVADLPMSLELLSFDLISVPPAPILKNLSFRGQAWKIGNFIIPANLGFCKGSRNR
jgi:CRISPR-associated protein Csc1